jgi:hypothetical protein
MANKSVVGDERLSRKKRAGANIDPETVEGFGREWGTYDQSRLTGAEFDRHFKGYFGIFPVSGDVSTCIFSLPMHPYLDERAIERILMPLKRSL